MSILLTATVTVTALIITILLGFWLLPILKSMKVGQTILEIGPRWHKDKEGTPTMGGILFIVGIIAAVVAGLMSLNLGLGSAINNMQKQDNRLMLISFVMALLFGFVGFIDDYVKVKQQENLGLNEKQKLLLQTAIAVVYMLITYLSGERSTIVLLPFVGQWDMGFLYYVVMVLGIVFIVNVVNFTDGIDGLCGSVTLVSAVGLLIISNILQNYSAQILSAATVGGCMGFLFWNLYPAKVFMGDTGSLFLGGMLLAIIFTLRMPALIIFCGFIYIIEGLSVLIQMSYFKYTRKKTGEGKRLFKMTPIHHHFEMSGWSENKIVATFAAVQGLALALAILAVTKM